MMKRKYFNTFWVEILIKHKPYQRFNTELISLTGEVGNNIYRHKRLKSPISIRLSKKILHKIGKDVFRVGNEDIYNIPDRGKY